MPEGHHPCFPFFHRFSALSLQPLSLTFLSPTRFTLKRCVELTVLPLSNLCISAPQTIPNILILSLTPFFHPSSHTSIAESSDLQGEPSLRTLTHLSVVLICRALLSILAPESSRRFPLKSTFRRQALEPRALTSTVPRWRSLESARERDCRAWRRSDRRCFEKESCRKWNKCVWSCLC